ncbi:hypothetical protein MPTK1_2g02770 [Marchantia polymorpha subsp. ruderalis]|uniref:Uncharacterized protein n=1 Tax=Marchantia polymorpha TaxID=3197 RepID=A0A2R6WM40_MARPO|nr:hypothetical protein MARPO_0075s0038 [Marchantia polymorpha]BBN00863.1 hypothetical protein Mp_2g02770 [Marchantia polymorpha subsp. ruderalis]|eukprot:PTQ34917.1 hypothetical protein MARPO_0075s0038 [Marchantia polymorpha]
MRVFQFRSKQIWWHLRLRHAQKVLGDSKRRQFTREAIGNHSGTISAMQKSSRMDQDQLQKSCGQLTTFQLQVLKQLLISMLA